MVGHARFLPTAGGVTAFIDFPREIGVEQVCQRRRTLAEKKARCYLSSAEITRGGSFAGGRRALNRCIRRRRKKLVDWNLNGLIPLPSASFGGRSEVHQHQVQPVGLRRDHRRQIVVWAVASEHNAERFVDGVGTPPQLADGVEHLLNAVDDVAVGHSMTQIASPRRRSSPRGRAGPGRRPPANGFVSEESPASKR